MQPTPEINSNSQNSSKPRLEELIKSIKDLKPEEQQHLVNQVLGKENGPTIVLGNNNLTGSVVFQINLMDASQAADILKSISLRIESEGK